jgi:hypothetical protein
MTTIKVLSYDDSDEDCRRTTYFTVHEGKDVLLAPCSLDTVFTMEEIWDTAQQLFGNDVQIDWNGNFFS